MVNRHRDYQKENKLKSRPDKIALRVARNRSRREAERKGLVKKGDGKIVHHIKNSPLKDKRVRVVTRSQHNRIHTTKKR